MGKTTIILLATIALLAFTAPATIAGSTKCTVTEVTGTVVVLDCGKAADKMKAGDAVKVKTAKKKAIEGC